MAIRKQVIMGRLYQANGEPIDAGFVRFTLNRFEATDNGVIAASRKIEAEIETDGSLAVELWPNTAGMRGTFYSVTLLGPERNELEKYGRINIGTDGPYQLADLLREEMPPAATSYWMSLTEAEFAAKIAQMDARVSTAETARDIATGARDTTIAARDAAEGHKNAAYGYAQDVASAIVYQNLAGVLASHGLNISDAFVYDTTKDFMGGLWRYQSSGKSWHDEEGAATGRWLGVRYNLTDALNKGGGSGDYYINSQNGLFYKINPDNSGSDITRGSRKDHPANAIITAEAGRVVIWDGDDPSLPMWRVIPRNGPAGRSFWRTNVGDAISVAASNGKLLFITKTTAPTTNQGLLIVDFAADNLERFSGGADSGGRGLRVSEDRSPTATFPISHEANELLASMHANDVAMTVLPGAPIDPDTGMPIPTIAVATDGGVSIIRDDGRVVDITHSDNSLIKEVCFDGDTVIYNANAFYHARKIPENDVTAGVRYTRSAASGGDLWFAPKYHQPGIYVGGSFELGASEVTPYDVLQTNGNILLGNDLHLIRAVAPNTQAGQSLYSYTAHNYATGWMLDPKGCWLASTDASDLVEVITAPDMSSYADQTAAEADGWSTFGPGWSFNAANDEWVHDGVEASNIRYDTPAIADRDPILLCFEVDGTGAVTAYAGTGSEPESYQAGNTAGVYEVPLFWGTQGDYIQFRRTTGAPKVKNVSLRKKDHDRSVNGKGLAVHGTVARAPVAEGAELVEYSGFSATNYLEQPYNPDLDFGTGDFCVMSWIKGATSLSSATILSRQTSAVSGLHFIKGTTTAGGRLLAFMDGVTISATSGGIRDDLWHHAALIRKDGVLSIYEDGRLVGQTSSTHDISDTGAEINVGYCVEHPTVASLVGAVLIRIGATAPTPEQIAKIYRDEKKLFQPGAQCTLYGDRNAVTALAHDDTKGLDLVGTRDGLSRFDGLLRVSHDDAPITTAIAAGAGYEVTE